MPQSQPPQDPRRSPQNVYRSAGAARRRKRAQRKKMVMSLSVLALLVVVLFVFALLLGNGGGAASSLPSSVASSSAPVSSAPPSSVSLPVVPQRVATPYDEEGIPALFNRFNKIPDSWEKELISVGGGQSMDKRAGEAFMDMVAAAAEDGITLTALSGFRDPGTQYSLYHNKYNYWLGQGLSEEEALTRTERYHAIPGTSEHEAGLAMDIGDANYPGANIEDSFADTPAFEWLQQNCTRFGFIYRYKKEAEDITHIAWEPWHYRYVGANHAEVIAEEGLTLEEYVERLITEARQNGDALPSFVPVFENELSDEG